MILIFALVRVGPIGGDETAQYNVTLDKEYSVEDFVNAVLSNENEWGNITVLGSSSRGYKGGALASSFSKQLLQKRILSVQADGGWSRMDYLLVAEK